MDIHEITHISHRQPHEARWKGLEYATDLSNINADYFQFLDDDDTLPPNWYLDTDWDADINWSLSRLCMFHDGGEMLGENKYWKTNVGGVIWKKELIVNMFLNIPYTIPPFIEPYLYMLVAYHDYSPRIHVKRHGLIRGFYGGEIWSEMEVDRITDEHKAFWKHYLSLPIPTSTNRDLNEYFKTYGKGFGPWRVE